ncbi:MAG: ferrochelatase, partial [Alphaproteobacteria bacterium]
MKCTSKSKNQNKVGILIVNLGSPDEPTASSVRKYLRQFLSDRRVIQMNPVLWQIILNLFILPTRPKKVAKLYKSIWNNDKNEAPLKTETRKQAEKIQAKTGIPTYFAMRYQNPSILSTIKQMQNDGIDRVLVIPLYPQYSATTTASIMDDVGTSLSKLTKQPSIRIAPPYYENEKYISALNNSIKNTLQVIDFKPEKIIFSYHGIPKSYHKKGDPYPCQCKKTTKSVFAKSDFTDSEYFITSFQSLFGKEEWVKPYTNDTLISLAKSGVKNVAIIAPAFASDCLETTEEICEEL